MSKRASVESTAEAYLELLAARGVEYFFGNAGTDFAPLIDAYAKRLAQGQALPRPLTIPHEVPAVAMAHGYAMVTGRPQVVMVHVIVGAGNALGGIINAARANVPIIFSAGRNPITEAGMRGSRNRPIHWAQESFDQGAMVREFVKWDYELRNFAQLETVVDRALALAQAEPQGPVYLTLPREVLAERQESLEYTDASRAPRPGAVVAAPESIAEAAQLLAQARNPIILTKAAGRDPLAVPALVGLAEALGAPVIDQFHTYTNFPQDHPLHAGFDAAPYFPDADCVVAVESDVPWFPALKAPRPEAKIVQIAVDPLFSRYPIRGFPADATLTGTVRLNLAALADAVRPRVDAGAVAERTQRWHAEHSRLRAAWAAAAARVQGDAPLDMVWLSRCVGDLVDDRTILVDEYDFDKTQGCFRAPGTYFGSSPAASLGWGLGAALGAKLAAPDKTVICCVGDGAYIFGAPTAAHFVSRAYNLPVLFVIFNNRAWNAVKRAVRSHAPEGWSAKTGTMPLSDLEPAPDYELVCRASGGWAERVEDPAALPGALARAMKVVREERRQALLNVICKKP
ncbi:MAG: thiamine pyrophosphate-requiring protein [Candidatus Rokubacteria bacterium]|nr:thiamine pyrophosphate-requiring protein [Candidatus Rokubacteria bacterium]MBI2491798.1 thiamine pyrophosphate-requiring protein [Candidatus Rokubacteria bacterium]MBI4629115.1 thiamine pyrophosphate-requiring protein [Candidatus Rokubacteria bacterium]